MCKADDGVRPVGKSGCQRFVKYRIGEHDESDTESELYVHRSLLLCQNGGLTFPQPWHTRFPTDLSGLA